MAKSVKKNVSAAAKKTQPETVKKISVKSRRIAKDTSNVNPEFTDQFIKEIDEDVKNDQLKVLWNKYGLFVIAFVVLAVSAAVSFEKIVASALCNASFCGIVRRYLLPEELCICACSGI